MRFVCYMAQALHTHKRGNSVVVLAIAVVIAGIVFFGIWEFLKASGHPKGPRIGVITHSRPVGGKVEDGVFRSLPQRDPGLIRCQI
jgi:hypothetical protein